MSKVNVYQYMVLDTNRIEMRMARRWGTREAIDRLNDAQIIEGSAAVVDASVLNVGGFSELDFERRSG